MLSEITTKQEWPTLANNETLAYFDNAASSQTHISVLKRMNRYYEHQRCNVNRGDYDISKQVSDDMEVSRESVADLLNCKSENIILADRLRSRERRSLIANGVYCIPIMKLNNFSFILCQYLK